MGQQNPNDADRRLNLDLQQSSSLPKFASYKTKPMGSIASNLSGGGDIIWTVARHRLPLI